MRNKPEDIPYGGLNAYKIRTAKPIFNEEVLEVFKYYVSERYKMHLLKDVEQKPFPWTEDRILSMYRFTNVRREHDKNSKYLRNIVQEHGNRLTLGVLCNIILFRLFNKIETMEYLGRWVDFNAYDEDMVRKQLKKAPEGYVYFTNAYLSSGMKKEFNKYFPQEKMRVMNIPNVVNLFSVKLWQGVKNAESPQQVVDALKQVNGISDFLAYQIFVDLTYLEDFPWSENEFVMAGPGCRLGLGFLFEHSGNLTDEELLFWLRDHCPIRREWCQEHMWDLRVEDRYMNIMSLENCMCELGKYMKAKLRVGRPRNLYKIEGGTE
jgi:hypothetical protein